MTEAAERIADRYRAGQREIWSAAAGDARRAWRLVSLTALSETIGPFATALAGAVLGRSAQSATETAEFFTRFRAEVAPDGPDAAAKLGRLSTLDEVAAEVRGRALSAILTARRAGKTLDAASSSGRAEVMRVAGRIALDGGRETLRASVAADPAADGWERVPSSGACAFCLQLASYGPVSGRAKFRVHGGCSCTGRPAYPGVAVAVGSRVAAFAAATDGMSGREARNVWRREEAARVRAGADGVGEPV